MVGKSNLILLIPTGEDHRYPANSVLLWDDKRLKHVGVVKFAGDALSCSYAQDIILVAQHELLTVLTMKEISVFHKIETCENLRGLQAISCFGNDLCIATPHKEIGKVLITWITRIDQPSTTTDQEQILDNSSSSSSLGYKVLETVLVDAHNGKISCFCLNRTCTILATASEQVIKYTLNFIGHIDSFVRYQVRQAEE